MKRHGAARMPQTGLQRRARLPGMLGRPICDETTLVHQWRISGAAPG